MIDFRQVASLFIDNNEVSELWIDGNKVWQKSSGLTFTAEEANSTVGMTTRGSAPSVSLEYSTDGTTWSDFIVGTTTVTLANVGDKMWLRAKTTNTGMGSDILVYNKFVMKGKIAASGSIMYLLKNDGDLDTISEQCCFSSLFEGCSSLTQAPELPATTLANGCYYGMFSGCSSLTTPPELPATTLSDACYTHMFGDCYSLTSAPELPATTLTSQCYRYMFQRCTSLRTAPELPATTLAQLCYQNMFNGCSSLNSIKIDYTGNFDSYYFDSWVYNVPSTGTFYYNGSDTTRGQDAIPTGWSVVPFNLTFTSQMDGTTISMRANANAPTVDLEYTKDGSTWSDFTVGSTSVLIDEGERASFRTKSTTDTVTSTGDADYNCFVVNGKATLSGMVSSMVNRDPFRAKLPEGSNYALNRLFNAQHGIVGSLKNLKLPFKKLEENCYKAMFRDCGGITEAPELPATELAPECYHAMFELCTGMATPCPRLEATDVPYRAYYNMFSKCYNLASAPAISAVDIGEGGMEGMFNGCTSLTTAPELPATTLANNCYMNMFYGCQRLNSIKIAYDGNFSGTGVPANAFNNWVNGVSASGTFYYQGSDTTTGASAIPTGWIVISYDYDGLTFEALENGTTIQMVATSGAPSVSLEYTTDGNTWNTFNVESTQVVMNQWDKVGFRGNNSAMAGSYSNYNNHFYISSGRANVMGNVCSVLDQDNYDTMTNLPPYAIQGLFQDCTGLIDASGMVMKAGILGNNCCGHLFDGCSDLEKGAEFFITQTGSWSMEYIYRNCSSLTEAYLHYTGKWSESVFKNWMSGVAASGTLYTDNQDIRTNTPSGCPSGWIVQSFS